MLHAIVFFPLIGFLLAGLFGRSLGVRGSQYITTGLILASAGLSWIVFFSVGFSEEEPEAIQVMRWIETGSLDVNWSFRLDTLTAVMLVVVNTVSSLVHVYSMGYMEHDPHRSRFFAYLSLFTFAMLALVTSNNLLQMFFGWEGVGLASYLLIGFWYKKPSANAAAMKAFVVNRVGDFGFILGIFALFYLFGSIEFSTIFTSIPDYSGGLKEGEIVMNFFGREINRAEAITIVCLLLFMGAMGKSAQFFLHTWLPDAMEGPTPVSALIHAATMVTAGVFLVARMSPLFEYSQTALTFITLMGATTAFFAATIGLVQNDIKRVIAYSTCSQLGYMFAALGVGAFGAAVFHLFTHAFFKALLFLGAGSVIHAASDEQDMRYMGGLRSYIPRTYWMMVIGTIALTGVGIPGTLFGTAGFFSKDAIIESVYVGHNTFSGYAFFMLVIAALLTSFYSWRLIFMTFHGRLRCSTDVVDHIHESPAVMLIPLYVLAIGALFAGVIFVDPFLGHESIGRHENWYNDFWRTSLFAGKENHILAEFHHVPVWVKMAPFVMMISGFTISWLFYMRFPTIPEKLARQQYWLYQFLLNKWYFDELYDLVFVRTAKWLGRFLWEKGDGWLIDGFGPNGISARVADVTGQMKKLQSGYIYHYAFVMLAGVSVLITWTMFGGGN